MLLDWPYFIGIDAFTTENADFVEDAEDAEDAEIN